MKKNFQAYQLYSQLTNGKTISDALIAFSSLEIKKPSDGDRFFEAFGVPFPIDIVWQPLERLISYELLLQEMKNSEGVKFDKIHKGTSYYFLATASFDVGDYEKAVFYLDYAFAEDVRKSKETGSLDPIMDAFKNPGGWLIRLNPDESGPAKRIAQKLKSYFEDELEHFGSENEITISLNDLIDGFVISLVKKDILNRSIITSLYSFIFEFEDRRKLLYLKGKQNGSVEPFLIHLFKGGLIFESILKIIAEKNDFKINQKNQGERVVDIPNPSNYRIIKTIGNLNFCKEFKEKYCEFERKEDLAELLNLEEGDFKNAFNATYNLRNMIGHDLRRMDLFEASENYQKLFEQEMAAILYLIYKEYIETK